jgi:hypothetical protein
MKVVNRICIRNVKYISASSSGGEVKTIAVKYLKSPMYFSTATATTTTTTTATTIATAATTTATTATATTAATTTTATTNQVPDQR